MALVTLVLYDIGQDRMRLKVEALLRDYGLKRAQRSVFRGRLDTTHRAAMVSELSSLCPEEPLGAWDIQLYVISEDDFNLHVRLGRLGPISDEIDDNEEVVIL